MAPNPYKGLQFLHYDAKSHINLKTFAVLYHSKIWTFTDYLKGISLCLAIFMNFTEMRVEMILVHFLLE